MLFKIEVTLIFHINNLLRSWRTLVLYKSLVHYRVTGRSSISTYIQLMYVFKAILIRTVNRKKKKKET